MKNHTELLLLPDGRILVHNLTPAMAALLKEFDPHDQEICRRSSLGGGALERPADSPGHPATVSKP